MKSGGGGEGEKDFQDFIGFNDLKFDETILDIETQDPMTVSDPPLIHHRTKPHFSK